jgi:hypothetical protein
MPIHDQTQGCRVSGHTETSEEKGANGFFQKGSLFKRVGRLLLTLLAIFIDIAT